jgi:hypothetical protein
VRVNGTQQKQGRGGLRLSQRLEELLRKETNHANQIMPVEHSARADDCSAARRGGHASCRKEPILNFFTANMAEGSTTRDEICCAKLAYLIYSDSTRYSSISAELPSFEGQAGAGTPGRVVVVRHAVTEFQKD